MGEARRNFKDFAVWPAADAPVSVKTWFADVAEAAKATLNPPPFPEDAARGHGQTVLVLPGFRRP